MIDVSEIPFDKLHAMGFKGVVFDKDNTLTVAYQPQIVPRAQVSCFFHSFFLNY